MVDRIIDAAKDGYVDMLKEATRKELNTPDEDGMTAVSWAASKGNLEALRLIVGRQGDVNTSDFYGNTPLHHAVQNGQFDTVSFLVHYGCNVMALDNDNHSALDLAAMNNRVDIVNFLDLVINQRRQKNPKQFNKQKEEALRVADSNRKRYEKMQDAAERRAEKYQRRLSKQANRQDAEGERQNRPGFFKAISLRISGQGSLQKSMQPQGKLYSDMAGLTVSGRAGVPAKLQKRRGEDTVSGRSMVGDTIKSKSAADVLYRTAGRGVNREELFEDLGTSRRPELGNAFGAKKIYNRTQTDIIEDAEFQNGDDDDGPGILNRPGGFNLTFLPNRNFLKTVESLESTDKRLSGDGEEEIGQLMDGAKSSAMPFSFNDMGDLDDDDAEEENEELSTIGMFLHSYGLTQYFHIFSQEKIDMETLMIMTDSEFKELGLPFGPRKKLTEAISRRKTVIETPSRMSASQL